MSNIFNLKVEPVKFVDGISSVTLRVRQIEVLFRWETKVLK